MSTAAVIGYGKLPVHGDFVRHNAGGTTVRTLDEWLQEGLYLAKNRLGRQFDAAYDAAPTYRFLYTPVDGEAPILGVLRPSRDRSRRTFPFLIATESDVSARDPSRLARLSVSFAAFLDRAEHVSKEIVAGNVGHREVGDHLDHSGLAAAGNGTAAAYERYLRDTTMASWCSTIWGFFDDSRKYLLFHHLLELLAPLRGEPTAAFTLGLRFPLGANPHPELDVAFWIELCGRILGAPIATPLCFWSAAPSESGRGHLVLFFRLPPARALSGLLPEADASGDLVCDLEALNRVGAAEAVLAIPSDIGALLESETLSLKDFLDRLSSP